MRAELEPTIDFVPKNRDPSPELIDARVPREAVRKNRTRSMVRIGAAGSAANLSDRFKESTRQLLRERLMIAAFTLIAFILAVKIIVLISGESTTRTFLMRSTTMALLGGILIFLYRSPNMPMKWLRVIEVMVIAVPITEALLVQYFETARLVEAGEFERILVLRATLGEAVSLFIAIYGVFIPSNWRRTALILMTAALLPTLLTLLQGDVVPPEIQDELPVYVTPALMFMMAIVGTLGAHVVHSIRRDAESAREFGQYQLTEEIGRGGMGVVYRAEHRMLKRPAAIKLIRSESADDELAIERFEREVQLSATLSHWNTVQIYDYGHTAAGDFYYVMEYLTGQTLADSLAKDGPKSVEATLAIAKQVCDGLSEAHKYSMVHRDLKPANIFLSECGGQSNVVKILDFGLAVRKSDSNQDNSVSGSPPYMSPEQVRGEAVDGRSDIYSIGCVIYECLTGRFLFDGESVLEILDLHFGETPSLEHLPAEAADLAPIIKKCVSRQPDSRYSTVGELRAALDELPWG